MELQDSILVQGPQKHSTKKLGFMKFHESFMWQVCNLFHGYSWFESFAWRFRRNVRVSRSIATWIRFTLFSSEPLPTPVIPSHRVWQLNVLWSPWPHTILWKSLFTLDWNTIGVWWLSLEISRIILMAKVRFKWGIVFATICFDTFCKAYFASDWQHLISFEASWGSQAARLARQMPGT